MFKNYCLKPQDFAFNFTYSYLNDKKLTIKKSVINLAGKDFISLQHNGSVVQLDRISDSGSDGWGFESLRSHRLAGKLKVV